MVELTCYNVLVAKGGADMKARICLECDHQNKENAWNCENCGATLSIEAIVDLDAYEDKNALAAKILVQ